MGRSDDSELAGFDPSLCIECGIRKHLKDSIYCQECAECKCGELRVAAYIERAILRIAYGEPELAHRLKELMPDASYIAGARLVNADSAARTAENVRLQKLERESSK